jgi:hypothetical protein
MKLGVSVSLLALAVSVVGTGCYDYQAARPTRAPNNLRQDQKQNASDEPSNTQATSVSGNGRGGDHKVEKGEKR